MEFLNFMMELTDIDQYHRICYIEVTPDNVLLKIFELLDLNSLINASTVCKKWKEIIETSHTTNVNFPLRIYDGNYWIENFDEAMTLERKIHDLDAYVLCDQVEKFEEFAKARGNTVRNLELSITLQDGSSAQRILSYFPSLKRLSVFKLKIQDMSENTSLQMENLKKLKVWGYQLDFLQLFSNVSIEKLVIPHDCRTEEQNEFLKSFLRKKHELKSLEIATLDILDAFPCKLEELKVMRSWSSHFKKSNYGSFINFLESQANSLVKLDFYDCYLNSEFLSQFFKILKRLEKLHFDRLR